MNEVKVGHYEQDCQQSRSLGKVPVADTVPQPGLRHLSCRDSLIFIDDNGGMEVVAGSAFFVHSVVNFIQTVLADRGLTIQRWRHALG